MQLGSSFAAAALLVAVVSDTIANADAFVTSANRISAHGYPAQSIAVTTNDSYILTMFRIPYSPKLQNENIPNKPAVLLQHGLLSSSDSWILNGPDNALAYMLADAGFDVWLGNFRGNTYSRRHATLSPSKLPFWNFSWHELAMHDLTAMIDHILSETGEAAVHYIGHSQGTTTFMALLSTINEYNDKIKTSHLLAPVGYMNNLKSPIIKFGAQLSRQPALLSWWLDIGEIFPTNEDFQRIAYKACDNSSPFQPLCANIVQLVGGLGSKHLNYTLLPEALATHPAGSSSSQFVHYFQEYNSGYFRQFDYGPSRNLYHYGQRSPPEYVVENIQPKVPVQFYYSDNDLLDAVEDVERLARRFGKNVRLHRIKYKDWNHFDFLWAREVKEVINTKIIESMEKYESKYSV